MIEVAVVMAAGKGTRMHSDLPKVCHVAAGKPLAAWVVEACRAAGIQRVIAIVGYKQELVREALADEHVEFAVQHEQLGTGHAAMQARQILGDTEARVFVLNGDDPMIDAASIDKLRQAHITSGAEMTLASSIPSKPLEYGRVIHAADGNVVNVVEERDCTPEQKAIRELNIGYYVFNAPGVWDVLAALGNANKAGEYYITDMARAYAERGQKVVAQELPEVIGRGVNTTEQLAAISELLATREQAKQA